MEVITRHCHFITTHLTSAGWRGLINTIFRPLYGCCLTLQFSSTITAAIGVAFLAHWVRRLKAQFIRINIKPSSSSTCRTAMPNSPKLPLSYPKISQYQRGGCLVNLSSLYEYIQQTQLVFSSLSGIYVQHSFLTAAHVPP